jgi:phospholipase C
MRGQMSKPWLMVAVILGAFAFITTGSPSADAGTPNRCVGDERLEHLIVIFDENVSFDHYFGTYPRADPPFNAKPDTPSVDGLNTSGLWEKNPNSTKPFLLRRDQYATSDQDHDYTAEQEAFDNGLMDLFPESTGSTGNGPDYGKGTGIVMGVYDGNTVTALWNYAQNFAMSDNSFGTTFGPSTPGALNLIAGRTGLVTGSNGKSSTGYLAHSAAGGVLIDDADPLDDICANSDMYQARLSGKNIGDLLTESKITWGWFEGGFRIDPSKQQCSSAHNNKMGKSKLDYVAHHEPFQYFESTANLKHTPPTDDNLIGTDRDGAKHQYDLRDFFPALEHGHLPTVSFLKAPAYQDGHAGYSDPLDEQTFLADTINRIESSKDWDHTAIVIMWDDSDGWYDHVMGPIVSQSDTDADSLSGSQAHKPSHMCGTAKPDAPSQGRCGYGPRLPFLIVSPFSKINFVDHSVTDQSSVIRYIEDRWLGGSRLGTGSTDEIAGSLCNMLDFKRTKHADPIFLDPDAGIPITRSKLRLGK